MKLLSSRWGAGLAAVLTAAILLCSATLLLTDHLNTGSGVLATPGAGHASQAGKGTPGDGPPSFIGYPAVSMEDVGSGDKTPVNSELLTMLLLIGFSWAILGLLKAGQLWYTDITCVAGYHARSFFSGLRQVSPPAFLAVFRL